MKKSLLIALAAAFAFTACQKEDGAQANGDDNNTPAIARISASHPGQPATRLNISVDHEGSGTDKILWHTGDKIIFVELQPDPMVSGYYIGVNTDGNNPTFLTQANYPMFELEEGHGESSATFTWIESSPQVDVDKKYIAFHYMKYNGNANDIIQIKGASENCFRVLGTNVNATGSNVATKTTNQDNYQFTHDNISFYAKVEFNEDGTEVLPLSFKMTSDCIHEFNVSKGGDVPSTTVVQFRYVQFGVKTSSGSSYSSVFNKAQWGKLDSNMEMKFSTSFGANSGIIGGQKTSQLRLAKGGGTRTLSGTPLKLRYPVPWSGAGDGLGDKRITLTLGVNVKVGEDAAADKAITIFADQLFTAPDAATPVFRRGVTYVKDIVVTQEMLDAAI